MAVPLTLPSSPSSPPLLPFTFHSNSCCKSISKQHFVAYVSTPSLLWTSAATLSQRCATAAGSAALRSSPLLCFSNKSFMAKTRARTSVFPPLPEYMGISLNVSLGTVMWLSAVALRFGPQLLDSIDKDIPTAAKFISAQSHPISALTAAQSNKSIYRCPKHSSLLNLTQVAIKFLLNHKAPTSDQLTQPRAAWPAVPRRNQVSSPP